MGKFANKFKLTNCYIPQSVENKIGIALSSDDPILQLNCQRDNIIKAARQNGMRKDEIEQILDTIIFELERDEEEKRRKKTENRKLILRILLWTFCFHILALYYAIKYGYPMIINHINKKKLYKERLEELSRLEQEKSEKQNDLKENKKKLTKINIEISNLEEEKERLSFLNFFKSNEIQNKIDELFKLKKTLEESNNFITKDILQLEVRINSLNAE